MDNYESELPQIPAEPDTQERIENFIANLKESQKQIQWQSQLTRILDDFEDFLVQTPAPPPAWQELFATQPRELDYWQIVLPDEYIDPYLSDLENIALLREKFAGQGFMALESELVGRNCFIYHNAHASSIELPEPVIMLASNLETQEILYDCCLRVYGDGSWYAYNLENDEEEQLGENFLEVMDKWLPILSKMQLEIPHAGQDYGWIGPEN